MASTEASTHSVPHIPSGPSRGSRRRPPRNNRSTQNMSQQEPSEDRSQTHHGGRGRGWRGRHGDRITVPSGPSISQRNNPPSSDIPSSNSPDSEGTLNATSNSRGGRSGRGRGRGRGRGGVHRIQQGDRGQQNMQSQASQVQRTVHGGRQFGGQLTEVSQESTSFQDRNGHMRLQADAPEFQPGQPLVQHSRKTKLPVASEPQGPKSTAPDIATRTHEDINNGHYECAICTEEIRRSSRAWSCRTCWTVFHLGCIKKWSTNEGSAAARQQAPEGELPPPRQWRCPGCNLPKDALPKTFSCWCEKELDPKSLPGLPPFSCGQTCSRQRILPKKCPHPCPSICHSGPCPPCIQMGPTQSCYCGKKSTTRRCVDTDYEKGWSCGEVCNDLLPCGEHNCPQACHEGYCGVCEVRVPARCYCGQVQKDILCCDRGEEKESSQSHIAADGSTAVEHWVGLFECPNVCGRKFDCGKHQCKKPCHSKGAGVPRCPRSPNVVTHCPCGKTLLTDISDQTRRTCEDKIPSCSKPCSKLLECGHECSRLCHQGDCPPCLLQVSISCRCGRTSTSSICHQGLTEPPQCRRICRVSLNCGRHECGEHCCPGERKAGERRKARSFQSTARQPDDGFEAEHICTRVCGRQLKCGNPEHQCQELCHKGPCGSCREAIFDEVNCHCGRTTLHPPLPCGTKPPPCRFQCNRPKDCGHPQVNHNCHLDGESCPKCPFLTTKSCLCGKNSLKNQPCWLNEVRCAEICGRRLKCGAHVCQKQCHRPGECGEPCRQPCGKELSKCGHPCVAPCHSPYPCKEDSPCQHKILVTCDCQRIKKEARCGASKSREGNQKNTLKCDDECARLARNQKLALALNVDPATHQNEHIPYSNETLNMYQANSTWAATQEKVFRLFAADPNEKRLRFKPMLKNQRTFLHSIAEDFGFDSESMDPEPHRHVAIFKTPRFVMAPMKTLAECARIRQTQRAAATAPHTTSTTILSKPKSTTASGDPFNAFIITNPRFALTIVEVSSAIKVAVPDPPFPLEIEFLPTEDVALRPPLATRVNAIPSDLQAQLQSLKPALVVTFSDQDIGTLQLCRLDASRNVLRKESDVGPGSGWSQIAAKGAPPKRAERSAPLGSKGGFAVLSLSSKKKQKAKEIEVADDWEAAEIMEEEREKAESGANSDAEVGLLERRSDGNGSDIPSAPSAEIRWADLDDEE